MKIVRGIKVPLIFWKGHFSCFISKEKPVIQTIQTFKAYLLFTTDFVRLVVAVDVAVAPSRLVDADTVVATELSHRVTHDWNATQITMLLKTWVLHLLWHCFSSLPSLQSGLPSHRLGKFTHPPSSQKKSVLLHWYPGEKWKHYSEDSFLSIFAL